MNAQVPSAANAKYAGHPAADGLPPVVLLHGWGTDGRVFAGLAKRLTPHVRVTRCDLPGFGSARDRAFPESVEGVVADLLARIPEGAVLIGWSLGGAIAARLARGAPERIAGLVTLASNPCFAQRSDWHHGMDTVRFAAFRASLQHDSEALLGRFAALQALGERMPRAIARELRAAGACCAREADLLRALDMLAVLDVREDLDAIAQPVLHILGGADALVPRAVAEYHAGRAALPSVLLLPAAGHAPFLSNEAAVAARIVDFIVVRCARSDRRPRDKRALSRSFARAARHYDGAAKLQRDVGDRLLEMLPARSVRRVLDIGCGTGAAVEALAARFPGASLVGLDIAEDMLRVARSRAPSASPLRADAEAMPLANAVVDVVYSNLALQWSDLVQHWFDELARVLAPGGEAVLSTFGPDTLWELRAAWRSVDRDVHVNRFAPIDALARAARRAGLECTGIERELRVRDYADVFSLARELRQLGAHNINPGRRTTMAARGTWRRLQNAYAEISGAAGAVKASFETVYVRCRKPHA